MSAQENNNVPRVYNMGIEVKKLNPTMLLIVGMMVVNVVIVGLLYGKSDRMWNRQAMGGGYDPSMRDVMTELYSMRHFLAMIVDGKMNVTGV